MKKSLLSFVSATSILFFVLFGLMLLKSEGLKNDTNTERLAYEKMLREHPFNERITMDELAKIPKQDRPDLAFRQNYLATMNPATGKPEPEKLEPVYQMVKQYAAIKTPGSSTTPWIERGPNNVGGRTRALAWDPSSTNKVWAGGVTGGLWYNTNITSTSSSWTKVNDFWDNIVVTAIAFDPNNNNIIYVGTGESYVGGRGAGVWKSTNGGTSFAKLSSTSSFYYINDILVRNESGSSVVYAAVAGSYYEGVWHGVAAEGLQRSTNGGASWTQVLPNVSGSPLQATDLDLASDNEIWVGVGDNSFGNGGGRIYSSMNGTSFTLKHSHTNQGRVAIACAPSNANYVYAAFESNSQMDAFKLTTNDGTTWNTKSEPNDADPGIPATDFTRGQAWYDLILDVDPLNMNNVLIGGIDLFKSTNGGTSWSQLSLWVAGFGFQYVHADQHAIVYKPGSSSRVIFGNDGGVAYSGNMNLTSPSINHRNKDYNVTQFYACAIHPTAGSNYFLAGAQDNGSQQFSSAGVNTTVEVTGGDGAFCHIDQTNGNYQSTSYVYNDFHHSSDGGSTFNNISTDQNTGKFINPSDLDDNKNIMYTYRTQTSLYKVTGFQSAFPTVSSVAISNLFSDASNLKVSPYTTASTKLFIGTESGRLFRISNANGTPSSTEITGNSFPTATISCIEFGQNENQIIVTFSNYGVNSVWYTTNGGTSWTSKEGNLPDMPVRWALFNPTNVNEVILATEVGVWTSSNFNASSPTWTPSNSGLANVRVDMLQIRSSDNEVIAATHGRGLFSSSGFSGGGTGPGYCAATSSTTPCDEFISNVSVGLGGINNTTTCGNYSDFTAQSVTVAPGAFVPMSITTQNSSAGTGYVDDQVAVWVDWNGDGDFTDPGEVEFTVTYSATTVVPLTFNLTVPSGAQPDTVRMRVRMSYFPDDGAISPCGTSQWGEVEDYTVIIQSSTPAYCTATSTNVPCDEQISNVSIGTINNTTTCGNYSDYTTQVANVSVGTTVPMTVSTTIASGTGAGYTGDQVAVWVDWNNDMDFTDPGEQMYMVTFSASTVFPLVFNIAVPAGATLGNVRMRVRMSYFPDDGIITPCGNSMWGEVEDYTLNVVPAASISWTSQPQTTTVQCDASTDPSATGTPTASTTCAGGMVNISHTDVTVGGSCPNEAVITRTWVASDNCGNIESYDQTINVVDDTGPTITCPNDQDLVSSNGTDAILPDYISQASVSDNCSSAGNISVTQNPAGGTVVPIGTKTVTLTATDECGNTANCSFDVEVTFTDGIIENTLKKIAVYPNPNKGAFMINLGEFRNKIRSIRVYNVLGEVVYNNTNLNGREIQIIDIQDAATGVFYVEIKSDDQSVVKKIMKL